MASDPDPAVPANAEGVRLISWRKLLGLLILPLVILAVMVGITLIQGLTRYDPRFFTEEYLERYDTPGSVATALEQALREGDMDLMAELVGTRRGPRPIEPRPSLIFSLLLDVEEPYFTYLYFNAADYHRVPQYVKELNGRYVASETDFYFYWDSGGWRRVAGPVLITWWILVLVFFGGQYLYRRTALERQRIYGR